jgi:ATP-binding protein involved in chromosome partitioning
LDPSSETLLAALRAVKYPGFSRDIVSFGLVRTVEARDGVARARLEVTTADPQAPKQLHDAVASALRSVPGVRSTEVEVAVKLPVKTPGAAISGTAALPSQLQNVRYRVAVASGKGGVGKSTFAVNLACAFAQLLARLGEPRPVGLMDCDIYGPSVPLMLGVNTRPELRGELLVPVENFGVRMMSLGLLIDDDAPVAWRGPMVMKTIQQFATQVAWGEIEILVVDLPPGTGDAHLTLAQTIPLSGAVIVTTPQLAAVTVARRGAMLFDKVNVPLLGVAENMSYLENPDGTRQYIFGEGGGPRAAEDLHTEFLGQVPLDPRVREGGDRGIPLVVSHPETLAGKAFLGIAERLLEKLAQSTPVAPPARG